MVALATAPAAAAPLRSFDACRAAVLSAPQTLEGYACLLSASRLERKRVLDFLEARLRSRPDDPRPRLYRALVRHFGGDPVPDGEWSQATAGFAREGDVTGEVYALTSHVGDRCFGRWKCDDVSRAMVGRADLLARRSGKVELRQLAAIWWVKYAIATDDLAQGEASEARLTALGEPSAPWLRAEGLMARAHLAAMVWDYPKQRQLYGELRDRLDPSDVRRPLALGGVAAASAHLALQGLEDPARAERLLREAIAAEERIHADAYWQENGYLSNQVHLALLLGPTPEAIGLLRSALAGQLARKGWHNPLLPMLSLGESLATQEHPELEQAAGVADQAVEYSFRESSPWEQARSLLLRSRIHFRQGEVSDGVADGLAALDLMEGLRDRQADVSVRMRYVEPLSVAYHLVSGAILEQGETFGPTAPSEAFRVMERLRARGLLETLAEHDRVPPVPSLAEVQGALAPHEALVSFQIWRAEPSAEAPYRQGSSWATLVSAREVQVVRLPDADVLEPQIRAFIGLLEARDGASRQAGARVGSALFAPLLARLPSDVESLVLVPDGALHRLPFDALSAGPGAPYLAERFRVSVVPSGAFWLQLRTATPPPAGAVLVLADPAGEQGAEGNVSVERAGGSPGFGVLLHARGEARAAMAAFPTGNELRTGPAASEAYLKSADLQPFSLIHIATHAVADTHDPERSSVVLAPGAGEDGRLEPGEISRLPLRGRTVVLAGCETSAGTVRRGEGVMSLARAFFSAGAVSVVGTLNRARDDETAAFFSELYRSLARGMTIGEAMADAKRRLIARGAPPAAWAEVVLLGDAWTRPRAPELPPLGLLLATAAVATVVGAGANLWRRRHR
jgi:hypothetical protein